MEIVAVASGKGGVGKSCVAAYTGAALAKAGLRTLLVELGTGFKSLDIVTISKPVYDILDVLENGCDPRDAAASTGLHSNLHLIAGGLRPPEGCGPNHLRGMAALLKNDYDYMVLDGGGFGLIPPALMDYILLVTTPDSLSVRACACRSGELYEAGASRIRLVINQVPPQVLPMQDIRDFDDIIDRVGAQLIAVIPESPKLRFSSNNGKLLDGESLTGQIFDSLAARLRGRRIPLLIR